MLRNTVLSKESLEIYKSVYKESFEKIVKVISEEKNGYYETIIDDNNRI